MPDTRSKTGNFITTVVCFSMVAITYLSRSPWPFVSLLAAALLAGVVLAFWNSRQVEVEYKVVVINRRRQLTHSELKDLSNQASLDAGDLN